ncbi:restriction endonuclease subunit S [Acinetobacter baumannii]|uniref:restriction endonuclease subunit S n=1 Tax=Acinetobacter baumannii TaxID=470 RepID=UPI001C2CD04B|nr:restriction endonuclease subunit S [Acinetobacter baumannii]MDA5010077.1 restriction endonuclease subunit S [Acinetobacter baumannii]QXF07844.1 restriction endonuclease subunit S [Acinetobacter baumannii]
MSDWNTCSLGEFVYFQRGHDLPKTQMQVGEVPVAGSNGVIGYHDIATTKGPGITIGRSGNIGTPKFYKDDFWAHNTVLYVKDFKGNNPLFAYYFLRVIDFSGFNTGSAVPTLNRNHIHELEIKIPPLPEQKAIASVLSSLDDKIDLLHRQNKTLEAMAETLFRQWFIEEAKEDWEVTPLSRIFDFLEGPGIRNWQYVENGVNFINIRLIDVGEVNVNSANKISEEEAFGKYKHFMLEEGDLIVSTSGTLGKSAIIRKYHLPLCLNTSVIRFRPKQDIYREFMYSYLKSRVFLEELETTASGSVQLNFGPTHLKKIDIRLPPTELIMSYHTITSEVFNKINSNFEQIQTLEKLRDTLLPKLMSGEVRVQFKQESAA